jgi:sulfatase maturation enzyme AslB (radical SAM superfamily)
MEFSSFTLILTYDCDFQCSYCYQKKGKEYLDDISLKKFLDFFFPHFSTDCHINFYGGEPLLAFDRIQKAVEYAHEKNQTYRKNIGFSLTTNGSRLNENVLAFCDRHRFSILLSFDGLAQEIYRKKGSFAHLVKLLKKIREFPGIDLMTNSVFTRETVAYLAESARFLIESGIPDVDISLSTLPPWDESSLNRLKEQFRELRVYLLEYHKKNKNVPVAAFRKSPGKNVFGCSAGRDRLALSPDGKLWGCCFFSDFCRDKPESEARLRFCFGNLDDFIKTHERTYPEVLSQYDHLRMDHFSTPQELCMTCPCVTDCAVCPLDAAMGSSVVGVIPAWVCRMNKITLEQKSLFLEELEKG